MATNGAGIAGWRFDAHGRAEIAHDFDTHGLVCAVRRTQFEIVRAHKGDRARIVDAGPAPMQRNRHFVDLAEKPAHERTRGLRVQRLRIGELFDAKGRGVPRPGKEWRF